MLRYVELKSGQGHKGPAWIARVECSRSGTTIYFAGKALRRGNGVWGNHFDFDTGEEYWVSGVKKDGTDRHRFGSGPIAIEASAVAEYLQITGEAELDRTRLNVVPDFPPTDRARFHAMENTSPYRPYRGPAREIRIEGHTPDELLAALDDETEALLFSGHAVVFHAGSATILGQFGMEADRLILELAQIEGGGEGVLPTLAALSDRFARRKGLRAVEWFVYATACAKPNLKLRRVLERRGFTITHVPDKGECYHQVVDVK